MKTAMHIVKERNNKREAMGDFFVITHWEKISSLKMLRKCNRVMC